MFASMQKESKKAFDRSSVGQALGAAAAVRTVANDMGVSHKEVIQGVKTTKKVADSLGISSADLLKSAAFVAKHAR